MKEKTTRTGAKGARKSSCHKNTPRKHARESEGEKGVHTQTGAKVAGRTKVEKKVPKQNRRN